MADVDEFLASVLPPLTAADISNCESFE